MFSNKLLAGKLIIRGDFTLYSNRFKQLKQIMSFVGLMILSQALQAQIYQCENDAGEIKFSDEPCAKDEASTRLNWLKTKPANKGGSKRKQQSSKGISSQAKKTAQKARKKNEAYVLLSLLTTTQLELETATLRSRLGDKTTELPELLLPNGITVDLLKVDKILLSRNLGRGKVSVQIVMNDGYEEMMIIKKPFPVISGEAKIGRFSKSLEDIKRIEFFNSKKLLKARGDKVVYKKKHSPKGAKKSIDAQVKEEPSAKEKPLAKEKVPVIELDLSSDVKKSKPGRVSKPAVKVVPDKNLQVKKLTPDVQKQTGKTLSAKNSAANTATKVQVNFANDKKTWLLTSSLGSSRNNQKAHGQRFILNKREQIPYDKIKSIRARPTADRSKLVVAVALKTGEIKMENMAKPFTRILGHTGSEAFNYSLLEIKSISFQR